MKGRRRPDRGLAAVVLAAGAGTRLRPLTELLPKPLCPIANVPMVDLAIERARRHTDAVAVNVHHHPEKMREHLEGRVHLSVEQPSALGTAGAVGHLAGWLQGRDVLVLNADAWSPDDLSDLRDGWDGTTVRLLVAFDPDRPDFEGLWRFAGASLTPGRLAASLPAEPAGLYEVLWRGAERDGRLELVPTRSAYVDCGTPLDYLAANLIASGQRSVVAPDAHVDGVVRRSVVLPGARVGADESLSYAIRLADGRTVRPLATTDAGHDLSS